jgi:3-hydroxyisobutyrate dehydrogenase
MMRVGFIGLGTMGKPMALNIARKGFPLTVFDIDRGRTADLVSQGAAAVDTPAEVARRSDVVITMLPNADAVRAVVTGRQGIAEGIAAGATFIDMSTSDPETSRFLGEFLARKGAGTLDAPVAKGPPAAEAGTLTIMVGGDAARLESCREVLQAVGTLVIHCGELGAGHVVKIVNNLLVGVLVPVCAEALALGVKAGVRADTLMEVVTQGSGNSFVLDQLIRRHVLRNDYRGVFPVTYMLKDLYLALDLARDNHVPLLFGGLACQLYESVRNAGNGDDCYVIAAKLIEELSGTEIRGS